jgi:hypothetical protein
MPDPAWRARAACKGKPTYWWFALPGTDKHSMASGICLRCPVAIDCTLTARIRREHGRWGCYEKLTDAPSRTVTAIDFDERRTG